MPARFPYLPASAAAGSALMAPLLPIELRLGTGETVRAQALLDTGAAVNVLPYGLGLRLGALWESQTVAVTLSGNLAAQEARGLILTAGVADFPPVRLAFAWSRAENAPLLLGQVNFFQQFDVCFHAARSEFEIEPARTP